MAKTIRITVDEKVAQWIRKVADVKETSVSKIVGDVLLNEMDGSRRYWLAYEDFKKLKPWPIRASERLSREEAHERHP